MELRDFLELVTADGLRCIAMQTDKGFIQMPAETTDDAVRLIEWVDGKKKNTYFALSTFKEEHLNENGKRRVARKRRNVDKVKALWLDIDYKSCPQPDRAGALKEVKRFLDETGFPKPSAMVSSGNGLHLYWPFVAALDYEAWHNLAKQFKQLCQKHGLPADHACTADASRVLRPIGTHNWKDSSDPKPVVWLGGSGTAYEGNALAAQLPASMDKELVLPEHLKRAANGDTAEFTAKPGRDQNPRLVFRHCGVMRHVLRTGGAEQSEPEWSATLNLLAHLDGGAKLVHKMSEGHADYDPDATMEKWQQKLGAVEDGTGPSLCSTFEDFHPDICKACAFYKSTSVKTPKSLAYLEPETPATPPASGAATPKLVSASQFQRDHFPKKWRVSGCGRKMEKKVFNTSTGEDEWVVALHDIWELERVCQNIHSKRHTINIINWHGGVRRRIEAAGGLLGSSASEFAKELADHGAIVPKKEVANLQELMGTWLNKLKAEHKVEDVTEQLGWICGSEDTLEANDDEVQGFATATTAYYRNGETRTGLVSTNHKFIGMVDSFKPKGALEPWKEAAQMIIDQDCPHLVVLLASAFAAPLLRWSGQNGAVLTVVSEDSAAGKTTGLKLAQSVWGDPNSAPASINDTPTVIRNKAAFLQNITTYWDEVRGDEKLMADFLQIVFSFTQGRDRQRANNRAETQEAKKWHAMLVATSNTSLLEWAARTDKNSDAGEFRLYELIVGKHDYPKHDAGIMACVDQLDHNYGWAGMTYAKWLADNFDRIEGDMHQLRTALEAAFKVRSPERFWFATMATLLLGAKYANEAGLTDFNIKRLRSILGQNLERLRGHVKGSSGRLSPRELVAAYAQQHQQGRLVVDWMREGRGGRRQPKVMLPPAANSRLNYVEARDIGRMFMLKSDFLAWLEKSKRIMWGHKIEEAFVSDLNMKVLRAHLGSGTPYKLPTRTEILIVDIDPEDDSDAES